MDQKLFIITDAMQVYGRFICILQISALSRGYPAFGSLEN